MSGEERQELENSELGIGIIGMGGIAYEAHLPAYRKSKFKIVAAADPNPEALAKARNEWGIEKVFTDYRDLLALPEVKIVDVLTPPAVKLPIVLDAIKSGKHVLAQKPFSRSFAEAKQMVEAAEEKGVMLAVNQQARWIPVLSPIKKWIEEGYLGKPYFCYCSDFFFAEFPANTWKSEIDPFLIIQYSIHLLDLFRDWFGEPKLVSAMATRDETQNVKGEQIAVISLEFADPLRVCFVNDSRYRGDKGGDSFYIEGPRGIISGSLGPRQPIEGELPVQSITLRSDKLPSPGVKEHKTKSPWSPDAFSGPMLDLMEAIREGHQPRVSGRDNLKTLQMIFAAYRSIAEKRAVAPEEIK